MGGSSSVEFAGGRARLPVCAPTQARLSWLSPLALLKTRFRCKALTPLAFVPRELGYKGNAFHTRFEAALTRVSAAAYSLLCGQADASRKPYVLIPPLDGLTEYPTTLRFDVELLLVGAAINHFAACRDALAQAGKLECGTISGRFEVDAVEHLLPAANGSASGTTASEAAPAEQHCVHAGQLMSLPSAPVEQLTLKLLTPLRLHNASRQAPTFHALMRSQLRRAAALAAFDPTVGPEDQAETAVLLKLAKSVEARDAALTWFDWERASPNKEQWMKLGGYIGSIDFAGDLTPFVPYLRLGEWLHVGGKTSFGLGKYRLVIPEGAQHGDIDRQA